MKTLSDFKRRVIPGVKLDTLHLQTHWSPGVRSIGSAGVTKFTLLTESKDGLMHHSHVDYPSAANFVVIDDNTAIFKAPWYIDGKEQVVPLLQYTFINEELMDETPKEVISAGEFTPLMGHTTEETAYVIEDYPWGYKMRCKQKVWLEYSKTKGFRVCRRTQDPRNNRWCAVKKDTYTLIAAGLYLDKDNHVQSAGLTEYSDAEKAEEFLNVWGFCLDETATERLKFWVNKKKAYEKMVAEKGALSSTGDY